MPVWAAILGSDLAWQHPDTALSGDQRSVILPQGVLLCMTARFVAFVVCLALGDCDRICMATLMRLLVQCCMGLTWHAGTQHGDMLRITGRGLRDVDSRAPARGDLFVQVSVEIPVAPTQAMRRSHARTGSSLDAACIALMKRLRALQHLSEASAAA